MTSHGRHGRDYGSTSAAVLIGFCLLAAVLLLTVLAAVTHDSPSPAAGAPGWHVTATLAPGPAAPVTVRAKPGASHAARPDAAALHAAHLAHLAHVAHLVFVAWLLAWLHAHHLHHLDHVRAENTT